jgi:hypothetical protein
MLRTRLALHLSLAVSTAAISAAPGGALCRNVAAPVALAEGQPANQQVSARLCEPGTNGASARTLLVLVHGITYDRNYWDIPDPTGHTDRYSFASAALKAKFSTLSVDRIGEGPHLGANVPTIDAYILPAAGHDMNPMLNARLYFAAVIDWLKATVVP